MRTTACLVSVALLLAACASTEAPSRLGSVPEIRPGLLDGYLPLQKLPDSLALLPPPPAPGSAGFAHDEAIRRDVLARRDAARIDRAREDADQTFPNAAAAFACALGVTISEREAPYLYLVLRRTLADAGGATLRAKRHYQRQRPFVVHQDAVCTPHQQAAMAREGSYPSGHSSSGWAWALILTELAPDRAELILARGLSYGDSRSVCNAHWASDIQAGRLVGAAAVARLHAEPTFRADLKLAREELRALRAAGRAAPAGCAAQTAAAGRP